MKIEKIFNNIFFKTDKSFEERKTEYIKNIYKVNKNNLHNILYENRNILTEIPSSNSYKYREISYIIKQLKDITSYRYLAPEVINQFTYIILVCIFLKDNNISPDKWIEHIFLN